MTVANAQTVIDKANEMLLKAEILKRQLETKEILDNETSGTLTVSGDEILVSGTEFVALRDALSGTNDTAITTSKTELDTLCDEIIIELAR